MRTLSPQRQEYLLTHASFFRTLAMDDDEDTLMVWAAVALDLEDLVDLISIVASSKEDQMKLAGCTELADLHERGYRIADVLKLLP